MASTWYFLACFCFENVLYKARLTRNKYRICPLIRGFICVFSIGSSTHLIAKMALTYWYPNLLPNNKILFSFGQSQAPTHFVRFCNIPKIGWKNVIRMQKKRFEKAFRPLLLSPITYTTYILDKDRKSRSQRTGSNYSHKFLW